MKANELMIGDWVIVNTYPEKVKLIGETLIKVWNRDDSIDVDDVSPIPLTGEILEKNGYNYNVGPGGLFQINIKGLNCHISFNIIHYVHELQHALRLCGIEKEIVL